MRAVQEVHVPAPTSSSPFARSVAACLAAILELPADAVPVSPAEHPAPLTVWRTWLAQRGLGFVPVHEPGAFGWPGPWLAVLRAADGDRVGVVAFGAPPGIAWHPLGGAEPFAAVEAGLVVAPADVALWSAPTPAAPRRTGRVEALVVAERAEAPVRLVDRAEAQAGAGLRGDRYAAGRGTFSDAHGRGHDLTLVEAEALEALTTAPDRLAAARRNVVTRGIDLDALIGRRFRVGEVECFGQRRCEPCAHLERLTEPGVLRALVHRGGLRADVLTDGVVRVGDPVAALDADRPR